MNVIEDVNILDLVIILGAIQGGIFAAYLWINPLKNKKASIFLSIFILAFAANCIYYTLDTIGWRGHLNVWDFSPFYCPLLIIGSFHFFIHYLIDPNRKLSVWDKLIFLPAIIQIVFQLGGLITVNLNRELILECQNWLYKFYDLFDIITLLLGLLLLGATIKRIRSYEKSLENNYSEIEEFSLRWLNHTLFFLLGIWVLFAIPNLNELITGYSPMNMYYPMWIATSVLIYWIGYSTYFRRKTIVLEIFDNEATKETTKLSSNTKIYHEQLISLMDDEQPYLNQDLNLKMLADKLELSSGYLSQIINQYENKSFFDFVNTYRVASVKEKIGNPDYDHLNLLGIAYESGFKSKSTFNLVFKKITGLTPTAFKKSQQT